MNCRQAENQFKHLFALSGKTKLIERILAATKQGSKAYWICPLIEESENLDLNAVMESYEDLSEHTLAKRKLDACMANFQQIKKQAANSNI